jgi:hypothetical protein
VPKLLEAQMTKALDALDAAVNARRVARVRQAAINVGHAALDLQLEFRDPGSVDRDRLGLWRDQLAIDKAASDSDAVAGDVATLETIHDRIN